MSDKRIEHKDNTQNTKTKNKKQMIFRQTPSQTDVDLSKTPEKRLKYKYPINKCLKIDETKINLENLTTVFVCIFHINDCFDSTITSYHPFLEYYLWKYPKSNKPNSDLFIFPFQKYNKKKTIAQITKDILKKLSKEDATKRGFLEHNNCVYMFFEKKLDKYWQINNIPRNQTTWWIVMDEICNSRRVLNFPIHQSVTEIFYKCPSLIYLLDTKGYKLETPTIAYYGDYYKLLPIIAVFGNRQYRRAASHGPHYYFKTYNGAIRYAGWTSNYTKKKFKTINISDDMGKYTQGGIIRFILFLGKLDVILNQPVEKSHVDINFLSKTPHFKPIRKLMDYDGIWAENFDSIFIGRIKMENEYYFRSIPSFVLKSFGQQCPLTMHMLDMSTLKSNWDPCYNKYYIK